MSWRSVDGCSSAVTWRASSARSVGWRSSSSGRPIWSRATSSSSLIIAVSRVAVWSIARRPSTTALPFRTVHPRRLPLKDLGARLDRRQRVLQVVRGGGQERILLPLQLLDRADVLEHRDAAGEPALLVAQRRAVHQHRYLPLGGGVREQQLLAARPPRPAGRSAPAAARRHRTACHPGGAGRHRRTARSDGAGQVPAGDLVGGGVAQEDLTVDIDQDDALGQHVDDLLEAVAGRLGLRARGLLLDQLEALGLGALLGGDVAGHQHEPDREAVGVLAAADRRRDRHPPAALAGRAPRRLRTCPGGPPSAGARRPSWRVSPLPGCSAARSRRPTISSAV